MGDREYDYIRGNNVIKPKINNKELEKQIEKKIERKQFEERRKQIQKQEKLKIKQKVMSILQVATVALVIGLAAIAMDGKVYKAQKELTNLEKNISVATAEGEALRVDMLKTSSIEDIKKLADELKMKSPDKNQTVTITIAKNFFENLE